jgi:hypothetical protein
MKSIVKAALAVAAIGSLPILSSAPASAYTDVSVGFSAGDVAFAYRDGYYDHDRRWHRWDNDDDSSYYRRHYWRNYHDYDHDRDDYWRSHYRHDYDRDWYRRHHHYDYDRDRYRDYDYNRGY